MEIEFNQAIVVTVIGFVVNLVSVLILGENGHTHDHNEVHHHHDDQHAHEEGTKDQNLKAAYLHVLADTMTSVFAILALLTAQVLWSELAGTRSWALLAPCWSAVGPGDCCGKPLKYCWDHQGPQQLRNQVKSQLENETR